MNKYLYIVNPTSGSGKGKKVIPIIEDFLKRNKIDFKLLTTNSPKHATELTQNNISHYNKLVAVGGDGTLNEVINGIPDDLIEQITLGVLPIGTGNDFVKNLHLKKNLLENLAIISEIAKNKTKSVDLGSIEFQNINSHTKQKHLFINSLGIGFDAYVGALTQNKKFISGISAYLLSVVKALIKFKMIDGDFIFNDLKISGRKLMLSIGNGKSHGGGFYLTPHALINDGLLDIGIFDQVSRLRLLTALPKALLNKIESVPEAKLYKTCKINIKLKEPYYLHCDGEIISNEVISATVNIYSKKINIIEEK